MIENKTSRLPKFAQTKINNKIALLAYSTVANLVKKRGQRTACFC